MVTYSIVSLLLIASSIPYMNGGIMVIFQTFFDDIIVHKIHKLGL